MSDLIFSGSYAPEDCIFLLKPIQASFVSIAKKEQLIQSGVHYSRLIHREKPPSSTYFNLFLDLTSKYKKRLAAEILALAKKIMLARQPPYVLLSLARAGTPIGVLLKRALHHIYAQNAVHYSISIIRDRGIDQNALDHVLAKHSAQSIVFIDGWTAKGVIGQTLKQAVAEYNQSRQTQLSDQLFVISDIGGTADQRATFDDYAIPSGLLNSTVSGLVSRSILNHQIGPHDFHGCVFYRELSDFDRSNWFIDQISSAMNSDHIAAEPEQNPQQKKQQSRDFLQWVQKTYLIENINYIKPGIAESTRVLLRRVPEKILLRDPDDPDHLHLRQLAKEKSVPIQFKPDMPFGACALIKSLS